MRHNLIKKISELDLTVVQTNNSELYYYQQLEKHINSLKEKFPQESVPM